MEYMTYSMRMKAVSIWIKLRAGTAAVRTPDAG